LKIIKKISSISGLTGNVIKKFQQNKKKWSVNGNKRVGGKIPDRRVGSVFKKVGGNTRIGSGFKRVGGKKNYNTNTSTNSSSN